MTAPSCMGGWCTKRDSCAHHLREKRRIPIERLCEPGQTDAWQKVKLEKKGKTNEQN